MAVSFAPLTASHAAVVASLVENARLRARLVVDELGGWDLWVAILVGFLVAGVLYGVLLVYRMRQATAMSAQEAMEVDGTRNELNTLRDEVSAAEASAASCSSVPTLRLPSERKAAVDSDGGEHDPAGSNSVEGAIAAAAAKASETADDLESRLAAGREKAAKVVANARQVRQATKEAVEEAWVAIERFVRSTATALTDKVQRALESKADEAEIARLRSAAEESANAVLRLPLPLLLAGLLAPMQLQGLSSWNWLMLLLQLPLLILLSAAAVIDLHKLCGAGHLWSWTIGIIGMVATSLLLRVVVLVSTSRALSQLRTMSDGSDGSSGAAMDPGGLLERFWALWGKITNSATSYFKALLLRDSIVGSWSYCMLEFLSVLALIWGGVGVYFSVSDIVEDEVDCPATTMRFAAHTYAFFYVVCIIWSCVAVIFWMLGLVITSEAVSLKVLKRAWTFDQQYSPSGLPVVTLLTRALLLRGLKDMAKLEAHVLSVEIAELRIRQVQLQRQEADLSRELEVAEQQYEAASSGTPCFGHDAKPEQLVQQYGGALADIATKVATGYDLLAQHFQEQGTAAIQDAAESAVQNALERAMAAGIDIDGVLEQIRSTSADATAALEAGASAGVAAATAAAEEVQRSANSVVSISDEMVDGR